MGWLRDVRDGLRSLRSTASLSLAVVLTLVVGVSMNSVVFSVFNGLLFRPAVTRDPSSFIQLYVALSGRWHRELHGPQWLATLEDFATVRRATHTLEAVTASRWASFSLEASGASLRGAFVSCDYLAAHVGPIRAGRGLVEADCAAPGGDSVVVLTERGWRTHFDSDPSILGRTVRVSNYPLTVVGIAPDDAVGPVAAMLYVPYTLQPVLQGPLDFFREPAGRHAWLALSGRVRAGRTPVEAQAELDVLTREFDRQHPGQTTRMLVTDGSIIHEPDTARSMPLLMALSFGTTGMILLMVCANVTTLLLARAVARRQEMALRRCLGASRAQLLRQLVTETAMLGGGAGIVGIVLAWYLPNRVAQMLTDFPLHESFGPDGRVIALTFGLAVLAGAVAGLSPALETLRFGVNGALRSDGRVSSGHVSPRLSGLLITNQLSISLALLIVLAMIGRAQHRLLGARLDYDPATVIVTALDLTRTGYAGLLAGTFYGRLVPAIEALPGVRMMAFSSPSPFQGITRRAISTTDGGSDTQLVACRAVSPGFFAMMRVRLLEGRLLSDSDARRPGRVTPVVVSNAFARRYYPGVSSLGRRIRIGESERGEIAGVVNDTVSLRATELDEPLVYQPFYGALVPGVAALVQAAAGAPDVAETIRARVQALDARAEARPQTVAAMIADQTSQYAAMIRMTAIPASLALFLGLAGIYGLTSFAVAQRTHEIAVRAVCGARPRALLGLFVRRLQRPLLAGLLGGSLLSLGAVWTLQRTALRLNLPLSDPLALTAAMGVLVAAALAATAIPVLRVARKNPWAALKE
jgi:predicted permease